MSKTFSYVKYDELSALTQQNFKEEFENLELMVEDLVDGRAKSLVRTKLEEAYMWIGKAIRDNQISQKREAAEQPERCNG